MGAFGRKLPYEKDSTIDTVGKATRLTQHNDAHYLLFTCKHRCIVNSLERGAAHN
jgi:hypothetical protein